MTTYTEKELVQFGQYLLSKDRQKNLKQINKINPEIASYSERKRMIFDADLENFKNINDTRQTNN